MAAPLWDAAVAKQHAHVRRALGVRAVTSGAYPSGDANRERRAIRGTQSSAPNYCSERVIVEIVREVTVGAHLALASSPERQRVPLCPRRARLHR
jgi:hypothetical protein